MQYQTIDLRDPCQPTTCYFGWVGKSKGKVILVLQLSTTPCRRNGEVGV